MFEEKIKQFLKSHNNYIMTKDIEKLGIDRRNINRYIEDGILKKVSFGIYMCPDILGDEYYEIQLRYPYAIFSYNTAFHLLNMSNLTPSEFDITSVKGKPIRKKDNYNIHYVVEDKYDLGIIEIDSPFGNPIKVYNAERCICDMLKNNNEIDLELQNRILSSYFNSKNKNLKLLEEYAKKLGVYEKVNFIIEMMMKW